MTSLMANSTSTVQSSDAATVGQTLMQAAQANVPVDLRAEGEGVVVSCQGRIIGADEACLLVDVGSAASSLSGLPVIRVAMEHNGRPYSFDTRCAGELADLEPGVIRMVKPTTLATADRRRSPRRRFREGAEVLLIAAANDDGPCSRAKLLNLSRDGIACRVTSTDAASLPVGAVVGIELGLEIASPSLNLNGRVVSVTEGGTAKHVVVGLEFIHDEHLADCRERLRRALQAAD